MSEIDPVRHKNLQYVDPAANLNEPSPTYDKENVDTVDPVKSLNQTELSSDRREMTMDVDPESDRLVVKVIDEKTQDVIYQAPPDTIVKVLRERRRNAKRIP